MTSSSRPNESLEISKIRCQCGTQSMIGDMIECEECEEWQHTYCMGIVSTKDTSSYKCEMCAPRLLMVTKSDAMKHQKKVDAEGAGRALRTRNRSSPQGHRSRARNFYPLDPEHLIHFLVEQSRKYEKPVVVNKLLQKYKTVTGYKGPLTTLTQRCRSILMRDTHLLEQFGIETKAKVFFMISQPVDEAFKRELQKNATITLDDRQRITSYTSRTVSFHGTPRSRGARKTVETQRHRMEESDDDDDDLEVIFDGHESMPIPLKVESAESVAADETAALIPDLNSNFAPDSSSSAFFGANSNVSNHRPIYPNFMGIMEQQTLNGMSNLVQSLTGLFDSHTKLMKEFLNARIQSSTPSHPNPPAPNPGSSEDTNVRQFLNYIRMYIQKINSLQLASLNHEIIIKSQQIGLENKRTPIHRLQLAIESALALSDASTDVMSFEVTSYSEFLKLLYVYAAGQRNHKLNGLCESLKRKIDAMDHRQMIQLEKVKTALETAVGIILME